MRFLSTCFALLIAVSTAAPSYADPTPVSVDLELSLVVDVSGSISNSEYNLQVEGYVDAFRSVGIKNLFTSGTYSVAVNMIMFAQDSVQVVDWTLLQNAVNLDTFADKIATLLTARPTIGSGATDIEDGVTRAIFGNVFSDDGTAPSLGSDGILGNMFDGLRKVIDVSGDGGQNVSYSDSTSSNLNKQRGSNNSYLGGGVPSLGVPIIEAARNDAFANGIVINGLAITANESTLDDYYLDHLVTSVNGGTPAGFVVEAETFENFKDAVYLKVYREITGEAPGVVPEPSSLAIFGFSALCLGVMGTRRRRGKQAEATK